MCEPRFSLNGKKVFALQLDYYKSGQTSERGHGILCAGAASVSHGPLCLQLDTSVPVTQFGATTRNY